MKKTNLRFSRLSVALLLAFSILLSCNKNEPEIEESIQIAALERSDNFGQKFNEKDKLVQGVISCFDENSDLIGSPKFAEAYGEVTERKALYISNQNINIYVFPLKMGNVIENLLLITNDNELFILEKSPSLALEDVSGTDVSPYITRIFDVEAYFYSTLEFADVENELQANYKIGEEDDILILEEKDAITGDISSILTSKLNPFCEDAINLMLPAYANFFNLPLVDPFDYTDLLYDAIAACHPSGEFCVCPIPTCVLENLIPTIPDDETKSDLMILYIIDKMNLECVDASTLSTLDFVSIEDMYNGTQSNLMTISDCTPNMIPPFQLPSCEDAFPFTEITGTYYAQTNYINLGFWSELNPLSYSLTT